MLLDRRVQGVDQRLDTRMLHLHRSLVHDQTRTDGGDQLLRLQTVGAQGVAGVDHVDDLVGEPHQRGQLHGAVQLDDVDLAALLGVVALGDIHELGRHAQAALGLRRTDLAGGHQLAVGDAQIEWLVQPLAAVLHQHILAGDAEIGRTMLDVGGHVGSADDQQTHIILSGRDDQLAALVRVLGGHDAGCGEQRQGIVEDAAFGQGDGKHGAHFLWNLGWALASQGPASHPSRENLARHAANLRAQQLQLLFDALVATINVVDAIDQACRRAQISRHDRRTFETLDAGDNGGIAFDQNLRAHAVHLVDVHEAILENGLDHRAGAFGNGVQRNELRLHVGRKRGVWCSPHVDCLWPLALHVQLDPVATGVDMRASLNQLVQHSFEQRCVGILQANTATSGSRRDQIGPGFNTVGHYAVATTAKTFDPIDGDGVGAGTGNLSTHGVEEVGQVNHLGLTRGVFQHAAAVGQRGGHHDVFGTGHTYRIEEEMRTTQSTGR